VGQRFADHRQKFIQSREVLVMGHPPLGESLPVR